MFPCVIKTFADPAARAIFEKGKIPKSFPASIYRRALVKLQLVDAAHDLEDLRFPPGNRLEQLAGDREGQHSIRINDQWRICFVWTGADAENVEIVDYH
ncbi:MAG: type II toxin-antitoxin system RelE/ParE family toxin [Opitutaceae bacterium]|jgi:proteic killer suppression protein|nr:type II toxin-antitoxin system RelE/ParE family toxin [Opitutaceae bacterium]